MKKILMCLLLMLSLVGCQKEEKIVYDYIFTNYLSVEVLGPDGYGRLYLDIKDFDAKEFKTEEDFIAIKKLMPEILKNTYVSKTENIKNGDTIEIGLNADYVYQGKLNIDLTPKSFVVNTLKAPEKIDLFDPVNVVFYGLEGTDKILTYFPKSSNFTDEVKENISYDISIDEKEVHENKTIITAEAELKESLLDTDERYKSIVDYFIVNGALPITEKEFTLKEIVKEKDFESLTKSTVENKLSKIVEENIPEISGYKYDGLVSVKKNTTNNFRYYIIAAYQKEDSVSYVKIRADLAYVDGDIVIYDLTRESSIRLDEEISNTEDLFDFEYNFSIESEELEDEPKPTETPEA